MATSQWAHCQRQASAVFHPLSNSCITQPRTYLGHAKSFPRPEKMIVRHRQLLNVRRRASVAVNDTNSSGNAGSEVDFSGKQAVVVGAGPAGTTAAMFLARQGFNVEVFERRPEPKDDKVDTGRAYIIILIPRGQSALEELGIELPKDEAFQTRGTVRHNAKGQVRVSKEEGNVTFSRSGLAQFLIEEARRRYPNKISFNFDADLATADLAAHEAVFQVGTTGTLIHQKYDLLVGADGVGSKVRAAMKDHIAGFGIDISDSGREYKVYLNLRGDIEPPEFHGKPGSTLHLFTTNDPFTTCTAHSNPDNSYSGTFSLRTGGFANLVTPADYEAVLREKFKGLPSEWIPVIAAQVSQAAPSSAGKRIRCSQLHAPGVLLLGDAAHAVTPVFGQGANSALESCRVLGEVLASSNGDVDAVPARFDAARRDDAHALYEIDRKAYSFFSRANWLDFLQLLSHVVLGTILSKLVPFLYGSKPKLMQLGSRTPYSQILTAVRRDSTAAVVGLSVLIAYATAKAVHVL